VSSDYDVYFPGYALENNPPIDILGFFRHAVTGHPVNLTVFGITTSDKFSVSY